jgi:hypothetical protein
LLDVLVLAVDLDVLPVRIGDGDPRRQRLARRIVDDLSLKPPSGSAGRLARAERATDEERQATACG